MIRTESWINPKIKIKESDIGGKGMFATEAIDEGEDVVRWGGEYVSKTEAEEGKRQGKLVMQWDEDLYSVEERGDDDTYFINHSCNPNIWMKDAFTLIARRKIKAGEEIKADYVMWEADEDYISKWECHCGEKDCRHKITGKDWRDRGLQERYSGHFSPLISKRIQQFNS